MHKVPRVNAASLTFSSNAMTRVLIVDDHPLFREALLSAVEMAYPQVESVEATNVAEAVRLLGSGKGFDLVLLDLNIPDVNGFDGLIEIRGLFPRLPVVVVSGHEDPRVIAQALSHGAAGFIPKSTKKDALAAALAQVMDGSIYVPESYSRSAGEPGDKHRQEMIARLATLTPQQTRVLGMLKAGLLNKQIAHELQVGETTVKAHVSEILRKLNVYSRTQAVIEMNKLGSLDQPRHEEGFAAASK